MAILGAVSKSWLRPCMDTEGYEMLNQRMYRKSQEWS